MKRLFFIGHNRAYLRLMKYSILLLTALLMGCSIQVKTYSHPKKSMSDYDTWCWMRGCDLTYQGPDMYMDEQSIGEIANAVAWHMQEKGYKQGDDQSDMLVNFYVVVKKDSVEIGNETEPLVNYKDSPGWLERVYPEYRRFLKGSLVIDVIDRRNSEVIFKSNTIKYTDMLAGYDKAFIWKVVKKATKKMPDRKDRAGE